MSTSIDTKSMNTSGETDIVNFMTRCKYTYKSILFSRSRCFSVCCNDADSNDRFHQPERECSPTREDKFGETRIFLLPRATLPLNRFARCNYFFTLENGTALEIFDDDDKISNVRRKEWNANNHVGRMVALNLTRL